MFLPTRWQSCILLTEALHELSQTFIIQRQGKWPISPVWGSRYRMEWPSFCGVTFHGNHKTNPLPNHHAYTNVTDWSFANFELEVGLLSGGAQWKNTILGWSLGGDLSNVHQELTTSAVHVEATIIVLQSLCPRLSCETAHTPCQTRGECFVFWDSAIHQPTVSPEHHQSNYFSIQWST